MKTQTFYLAKTKAGQSAKLDACYPFQTEIKMKKKMVDFLYNESDDHYYEEGAMMDANGKGELLSKEEVENGISRYSYDVYTYELLNVREAIEMFGKDAVGNSQKAYA
jgi:hypothetical protein